VSWGIVRGESGEVLRGNPGDYDTRLARDALAQGTPKTSLNPVESGDRQGQTLATYAAPIRVPGESGTTALVFARYYTESDIENAAAALSRINQFALLAGALALLIGGSSGYVVANLISRRLNRLDVAARRLAAGNFEE